jgi:hypothetical protein
MNGPSKLQPNFSVTGIGQPMIALVIFALFWALYGITAGMVSMAAIFAGYAILSLIYLLRTENPWFFVTFIYQTTVIIFIFLAPKVGVFPLSEEGFKPLILILIVELAVMIYIIAAKKLRWRGREILELAASHVEENTNGFTERPRALGKIDFSPGELNGFTLFLKSSLIAWPIKETNRIVLVPVGTGNEYRLPLGFSRNYAEDTWVSIDMDGNVMAQISRKDYLKYKEALAFDQLVESMGLLFIDFFEKYMKGEKSRIMYELNQVKVHPFA